MFDDDLKDLNKIDLTVKFQFKTAEAAEEAFSEFAIEDNIKGYNIERDGNILYLKVSGDECDSPLDSIDKIFEAIEISAERSDLKSK